MLSILHPDVQPESISVQGSVSNLTQSRSSQVRSWLHWGVSSLHAAEREDYPLALFGIFYPAFSHPMP